MKALFRRIACYWLCCWLLCLGNAHALVPSIQHGGIGDTLWLYDTEGHVGAIRTICPHPGNGWEHIYADIGGYVELYLDPVLTIPYDSRCGLSTGASFNTDISGTPFYVRRYHPDFGCLSSFGYVGAKYRDVTPSFVLPVPFSQYGITKRIADVQPNLVGPSGHAAAFYIREPMVADNPTSFSLAVDVLNLYNEAGMNPILPTIHIEYLPGNTRTGSRIWAPTASVSGYAVTWTDPLFGDTPSAIQEGLPVAAGPIRVSVGYDGYTTDTVELVIEDLKEIQWTPIVGPAATNPGITPSFLPLGGIMDQGVADVLLGECTPSGNLATAKDPNSDLITDAADFVMPDPE